MAPHILFRLIGSKNFSVTCSWGSFTNDGWILWLAPVLEPLRCKDLVVLALQLVCLTLCCTNFLGVGHVEMDWWSAPRLHLSPFAPVFHSSLFQLVSSIFVDILCLEQGQPCRSDLHKVVLALAGSTPICCKQLEHLDIAWDHLKWNQKLPINTTWYSKRFLRRRVKMVFYNNCWFYFLVIPVPVLAVKQNLFQFQDISNIRR